MRQMISNNMSAVSLGKQGENMAREIAFAVPPAWESDYGPGVCQMVAQRPGETEPYPVALARAGGTVVWTVTGADTAISGRGRCELRYLVGEVVKKSRTWGTIIAPTLAEQLTEPPESHQGWVDRVLGAGAAAESAASRAEEAAERAETALGEAAWIAFELDGEGNLWAVTTPGFEGAEFAITEDGYLEVIYGA